LYEFRINIIENLVPQKQINQPLESLGREHTPEKIH
jgi:hypothetical protein